MVKLCLKRKLTALGTTLLLLIGFQSTAQITNPAMGQGPWKSANPAPTGAAFTDMSFIDDNNGLASAQGGNGGYGGLLKTTDGGRTWKELTFKYATITGSVALGDFVDVQFVTPSVAYAVGPAGLMVKSTDGGNNWTRITTPLTPFAKNINALHFINKDTGYIGGQALLTTTNTTDINAAPKIYFTHNGGVTWDSLASPFRPQQNAPTFSAFNTAEIVRLHFANDSVGYASGSCATSTQNFGSLVWKIEKNAVKDYSIHRTKFGIVSTNYTPATQRYTGCLAINDSLVLVSGTNSVVMRIKTGKNDSTANALPAIYGAFERGRYEWVVYLNAIPPTGFPAPLVNNVAGNMNQIRMRQGKIYLPIGSAVAFSEDNGTNWTYTKPHPATERYNYWQFSAIDVTPNGRIVIGSYRGVTYDSLPGSAGWQTVYSNVRPLHYLLSDMDWADYCNGVAVGGSGTILKTSDGGKTWVNNSEPSWDYGTFSTGTGISFVKYPAPDKMFYVAGGTILYRSPDQGTTYTALFTEPTSATINGLEMIGSNKAFLIAHRTGTQRTHIYRINNTSTGPVTVDIYNNFPTGTSAPTLRNIKFANQDTGYTCGSLGKVYRTIDGGTTWTDISPFPLINGTANFTALSVVNGRTVYVGGPNLKLFRSTDAGVTWTDLTFALPPAPSPFTSFTAVSNIIMNDANSGYIAAGSGAILMKTSDAWATWTYDLAPVPYANMALYPKMNLPLDQKILYGMQVLAGGSSTNTLFSASLLQYGNAAQYNMSTAETSTSASCTNPTAGSITITATGGIAPYTYSIDGGAFQTSNVFTGLTTGNKTVVIKDAGCQVITKTINIAFTDNLTLTASNDTTVCAGAPVQLQATATSGATFTWTPTAGLSNPNISNPVATVSTATTFTVRATLNGCVKTDPVNIAIKPNPVVSAGTDKTIVEGDEVQLTGSASNIVSIAWTPSNTLRDPNTLTPVAKPTTTTTYTMTVKNSDNCTSTDDVKITVLPYCVKVMNAFSPNGDGANDRWIVTDGTGCTNRIKAAVFNRYGQQVYVNENYQNNWDGTFNGKPVPDGTYYYAITYFFVNGRTAIVKGDVTILR